MIVPQGRLKLQQGQFDASQGRGNRESRRRRDTRELTDLDLRFQGQ